MESREVVSVAPHECSVKGGEHLVMTFCNPVAVPDDECLYLLFSGSADQHRVPVARLSPSSLTAFIPPHSTPEEVQLSLCSVNDNGLEKTIYTTRFTYYFDQKGFMADLLQSVRDGSQNMHYGLLPPLPSPESVREYDMSLTEALQEAQMPEGWSLVGMATQGEGQKIETVEDCEARETLLHFAARHGLNSLAQHLLSLPGSSIAAVLPNLEGQTPIELAREQNNEGLVQLLTLYMKQVRPDGKFIESPSPSPKGSPIKQVHPDGKVIQSPSPKESPTRPSPPMAKTEEIPNSIPQIARTTSAPISNQQPGSTLLNGGGTEDLLLRADKNMQEMMFHEGMMRINEEWRNQVQRQRKSSLGSLMTGSELIAQVKLVKMDYHCITRPDRSPKSRRNSCAFISVPHKDPELGVAPSPGGQQLECVSHIQDPEIANLNRQRKNSWSATVGSTDSRSVDTGLNELHRIMAEESLQERLRLIRAQLMERELAKPSNHHLAVDQSQFSLRSMSCPLLGDSEEEDESASPGGSPVRKMKKSASSSSAQTDPSAPLNFDLAARRHEKVGGDGVVPSSTQIPRVITTSYSKGVLSSGHSDSQLINSDHENSLALSDTAEDANTTPLSVSVEDLDSSSVEHPEGHGDEGTSGRTSREERSTSLLAAQPSLEEDCMAAGYSISAPDLLTLSDQEDQVAEGGEMEANKPPLVAVEESIAEHRMLRQISPGSERETDNTNTSMESDYVIVQSPNKPTTPTSQLEEQREHEEQESEQQQEEPELKQQEEGLEEQDKVNNSERDSGMATPQNVEVTRRVRNLSHQVKGHRRSLSTSDVEAMREASRKSIEAEEEHDGEGGGDAVAGGNRGGKRPSTSTNLVAILTPISNADEVDSPASRHTTPRKMDVDEHSQADSVQTLDTSSLHGSDSSEEDNAETDDQLSALDSQVIVDPVRMEQTSLNPQVKYNGVNNLPPVVLRSGASKRRSQNFLNRYSAECLITNIDDEMGAESDGETTPTLLLNRLQRRINSTNYPLTSIGSSDGPMEVGFGDDNLDGSTDHGSDSIFVQDSNEGTKKVSMCSNDSVFAANNESEVVHLSDVDVKINSDEGAVPSLESSFDISLEQSTDLDDRFYKQSGSPRTIRKKNFLYSPKSGRRHTSHATMSPKSERKEKKSERKSATVRGEKKGLKRADVSPTIKTLKRLMDVEEQEDSLSDDSDSTVGSGPARTTSALGRNVISSVQRSSSSVSDSIALQQHRAAASSATATGLPYSPSFTQSRSPIQMSQEKEEEEEEEGGTSLDFVPGSPMTNRKQQPFYNQQSVQPVSPLSFSQIKSPTTISSPSVSTLASSTEMKRQSNNSSPSFCSSPLPGNTSPPSKHEDQEIPEENHVSTPPPPKDSTKRKHGKFEKSKSFFETESPSVFFIDQKEGKQLDKDHESTVKKLMRASIFRGSRQNSKKLSKSASKGADDTIQDNPGGTPNTNKRVKSAKLTRSKPSDSSLETVPCVPAGSNITRSASMQVGLEDAAEIQASTKRRSNSHMNRYNSDDVLVSPSKKSGAHRDIIEEEENAEERSSNPALHVSGGESDNEEVASMEQIALSANHPLLQVKEDVAWERTVDRKLYKKISKAERERQAILHELLHTEKQYFRALHVLKIIFRHGISKQGYISEETLSNLFPKLDDLIDISNDFIKNMEKKRDGIMINDLSDVLLRQFTGETYEQMLSSFSGFCSGHLNAMEIYKELSKKKNFTRLMSEMHSLKECHRLTLPDYYTKVTQRLSQLIILMNRLAKKTESLKLDHYPVIQQSMLGLQRLVSAVDQSVEDRKNHMEVMDIQSRLEVSVPKSSKITNRQDLKNLSLTAHNRKLKKRGDATWMGHGRQLGVQVLLVTDFLVLLTERDQKFHLATLQDLKPPVIRLYDLMVRPNVSVKSGVQLLLVEQSSTPEMYKLDFADKKKAKEWLNVLNGAIEECRDKGLKCERFGGERVTSGDEERKQEEREAESGEEGKKVTPTVFPSKSDPEVQRHNQARESLRIAEKLLLGISSASGEQSPKMRHQEPSSKQQDLASSTVLSKKVLSLRQRSNTTRPKTAYFLDDVDVGGTSATIAGGYASGDHVISPPQLISQNSKGVKPAKEKKKVNRSSTFRSKEKKEEKEKEKEKEKVSGLVLSQQGGQSADGEEGGRVPDHQYVSCITALKDSLLDIMNESEEKSRTIEKLQAEVQALQKAVKKGKRHKKQPSPIPVSTSRQPSPSPPPSTQHLPHPTPTHTDTNELSPLYISNSDALIPQSWVQSAETVKEARSTEKLDAEVAHSAETVLTQHKTSAKYNRLYDPSLDSSLESTKL